MNDELLGSWLAQAGFKLTGSLHDDINVALPNSTTPLMHAARVGDIEAVKGLLVRGADPARMNSDGNGALWFACFADSEECVTALIKAGAPLDSQNVNGATALIYCASAGKSPLVQLLLEAGANPALMTLDDFTALELAANMACLKLLKAAKAKDRMPEQPFVVSCAQHRLLGKQIALQFEDDFVLKLSPVEASSLSFALVAVREGTSPEREIYMSPIASDVAFVGTVLDSGMSIATSRGKLDLPWSSVGKLAEKLAAAV